MSKESTPSSGGIGFVGLLTILFVALKLTGHISWTWTWVLSPLWISGAMLIFAILAVAIVAIATANRGEK